MKRDKLLLLFILFLAAWFRFNNLNWDLNAHLHPDERFLTMVGNAMKLSGSWGEYMDQHRSLFNPANINYTFFVYGMFPLILNKLLALRINTDTYSLFTLQGRFLSGLFDMFTLLLVYKIAELLFPKQRSIPLWSAFFYGVAVLPIQLSHYFAVDTFLNFFMIGSFYFALHYYAKKDKQSVVLSSLFFGLAVACKVSAVFILPLNLLFILFGIIRKKSAFIRKDQKPENSDISDLSGLRLSRLSRFLLNYSVLIVLYLAITYIVVRIADPYYFEYPNLLDPRLNVLFMSNIKSLKSFDGPDVWFPPAVQWMTKPPVTFSLINLALLGVGLPYFILIFIGILSVILEDPDVHRGTIGSLTNRFYRSPPAGGSLQNDKLVLILILLWVVGFFLYQSTQFVKAMRYFIFIYPFLAIFAAIGVDYILGIIQKRSALIRKNQKPENSDISDLSGIRLSRFLPNFSELVITSIFAILILIWPIAFSSIYMTKNSRIVASEWIYKHIENNALILSEHWDDGLPIPLEQTYGKQYVYEQLPIFDPDAPDKWQKINVLLKKGDYYILSSNRGWGSIPTVPKRYPQMTAFYQNLFANKLEYKHLAEFHSYPSLRYIGIPVDFPDDWADESFTVYDHPKVMIFKKLEGRR